mmetsp:Transcript_10578/g.19083  ORF Transcript_10578/g.19083 Transcript_10578/m.19083 type:complete len:237 (-) Transcript_10578:271-981(-)
MTGKVVDQGVVDMISGWHQRGYSENTIWTLLQDGLGENAPSRQTLINYIKQLKSNGTIVRKKRGGPRREKVFSEEEVKLIHEIINDNASTSMSGRKTNARILQLLSARTGVEYPPSAVRRISDICTRSGPYIVKKRTGTSQSRSMRLGTGKEKNGGPSNASSMNGNNEEQDEGEMEQHYANAENAGTQDGETTNVIQDETNTIHSNHDNQTPRNTVANAEFISVPATQIEPNSSKP